MAFDFDAEKYKKASGHQRQWGKKLIAELNLKDNERILDLGCGDGAITAQLAELVTNGLVVGIDASQGMIEVARKAYKARNLRFDLMDINEIDFEDEFDVVFSNAVLHWVEDHERLIANVYRSLRIGGVARFNFAGDGNCSALIRILKEVMVREEYAVYFERFQWPWCMPGVDEYEAMLDRSDFREARVWAENADRYFADAEEMTRWIDQPSIVPFLKCVDAADEQAFRDAVVERMIKETIQPDGTYFETFRRVNVFAKK